MAASNSYQGHCFCCSLNLIYTHSLTIIKSNFIVWKCRLLIGWWGCWECNLDVDRDDSVQVDSVSLPAAMKGNLSFRNSFWKNCCMFKWRASRKKRSWHPVTLHKTARLLCVVMETIHSLATFSSALINSSDLGEMMEPSTQMKDGK